MLKITGDGRKAALDMRLATGQPVSRRVQARHRRRADRGDLARAPRPALQRPRHRRALTDPRRAADRLLRPRNTPRGLERVRRAARSSSPTSACPATRSATSTRPATTPRRAGCSRPARAGHVAVLIGSTEKMGVGTNIQARAVALHLFDCPWRPADHEQREGRILRQGNQNPRYGSTGTSPKARLIPTPGRRSSAKPGSSTR